MDDYRAVIAELRRIRRAQGISQAEVARRMGTTQSHVNHLEGGSANPQLATLMRFARAVGTRLTVNVDPLEES